MIVGLDDWMGARAWMDWMDWHRTRFQFACRRQKKDIGMGASRKDALTRLISARISNFLLRNPYTAT